MWELVIRIRRHIVLVEATIIILHVSLIVEVVVVIAHTLLRRRGRGRGLLNEVSILLHWLLHLHCC